MLYTKCHLFKILEYLLIVELPVPLANVLEKTGGY